MAFCCCCCSWIIYTCVVNLKSKLENKKKNCFGQVYILLLLLLLPSWICHATSGNTHTTSRVADKRSHKQSVAVSDPQKNQREIERGKKKRKNKWVAGNGENRFYCSSSSPKGTWLFVGQAIKRIRAKTNTCKHTLRQQLKAAAVESNESFPSDDESFSLSIFNEKRLGKAHKRPLLWKIQLSCGFNVAESICQVRGKAKGKVKTFPKS